MVSTDSCFALSMKAHVFTTSTSALEGSRVSSRPDFWASPSITSESTRFLGQPRETRPIFFIKAGDGRQATGDGSRIQPVQHTWVRDGFPHVLQLADPRNTALDTHAEAAVGY